MQRELKGYIGRRMSYSELENEGILMKEERTSGREGSCIISAQRWVKHVAVDDVIIL